MISGRQVSSHSSLLSRYITCVAVILFSQLSIPIYAQRLPQGEALTIDDGLGFRNVTAITQDHQGLIWIGTRQGINRYDSYHFTKFGNDRRADVFFQGGDVLIGSMHTVSDSTIWLIADNQLYTLNRNNFRYEDITIRSGITGKVWQLQPGDDGSIWAVWEDADRQYLCRSVAGQPFSEVARENRGRREFTSLAIDTSGNAWWSTITGGLKQYNPEGTLLHESRPDSFIWYGTMMYYTPVFVDRSNRVFIFPKSTYQIWHYHPHEKLVEVIVDSLSSQAYNAVEDRQGNVWFSSKTQLLRWNTDHTWTDYSGILKEALQFGFIQGLYEDETSLLWVATDNGLIKLPNHKQYFQNLFTIPGTAWGNAMRGIFEDRNGYIYSYCEKGEIGLHRTSGYSGTSEQFFFTTPGQPTNNLTEEAKHFILDRHDNAVWTLTDQLIKIDLSSMKPVEMIDFVGIADRFTGNPLVQLKDETFLLGSTLEKLTTYNAATGERKKLLTATNPELKSVGTKYFLENNDGSIWVASDKDGLYRIHRDGRILQQLTTETHPALSNNHLLALHHDAEGYLWIGTFGGGLNKLDEEHNTIQIFALKEGLANDNVTGILSDDQENIWASTYNGLSCYRKKEGTIQNFYEEDGLSNNEFNYTSFYKDRHGRLWFGGMNGVQYFNPEEILEQRPNPPLSFTGFSKYNRLHDSLETRVLGDQVLSPMEISPYDSYFQFTWTLPNYFKPEKNRYYVWLEGLENDWSYVGSIPTVRYHKLPSGNYTLHIKGADSKGNWSETELAVPIHVKPFFYMTWWFITCCILLLGSLVFAFTRYRLQRLLEMERMRTRIAGDLHDEVGSMLSGLAMQAEIMELDQQKSDPAKLHRLSEISRLTLSKMRDVVWSIDSRRDQVKDLLDRMRENAEEMLTPKEILFRFELGDLPMEKKLPVDERQHLFLFYKEAINNVAKHSNASIVNIRFGQFGDHFELSIHDNGISAGTSTPSGGFGLQNLEMRANKLGAAFFLNKEDGFKVGLHMKSL